MPEILTESFCERCGTRYTFESAAPRAPRLKGVKVLSRGLKNFVMSDDTSLDEAMAAARSDTDREVTSQQLDAFHKTFNFCMQCRQYTCANCWNEAEGRCLTCAPHLGHDILEAPFPTLAVTSDLDLRAEPNGNGTNGQHHDPALDTLAWPTSDLSRDDDLGEAPVAEATAGDDEIESIDAVARLAALGGAPALEPATEKAGTDETVDTAAGDDAPPVEAAASVAQPSVETAAPADAAPTPGATDIDGRAAAAASATSALLRSFRPGQSLDAALEAYEREQAGEPTEAAEAAPVARAAAAAAAAQTEAEPEHDHAAAAAAAAAALAASTAIDQVSAAARPTDHVRQPTWQIVAPDLVGPGDVAPAADAPAAPPAAASAEPQWPTQPQWPSHNPSAGLPFLGRPATPTGGIEALWAESAREVSSVPVSGAAAMAPLGDVKAAGGVQPCVSCGLSLSATARFCRRCGIRQG